MEPKVYVLPIANRALVIERIEKMQRRAEKMGLPFPDTIIGEPYKVAKFDPITGTTNVFWRFDVTMSGEGIDRPISYGGWKIVAQFNHEYPKVILNKLVDNINPFFITRFEAENISWCQDCNKAIRRNNTYVIENESGEQMLVGSACMHKYVPCQKSVDDVMKYYLRLSEDLFGEDGEGHWEKEVKHHDTEWFLKAHFMVLMTGLSIKDDDFTKVVSHVMSMKAPSRDEPFIFRLYSKALSHYDDASSEMFHMMKFIQELPEDNEFNVRLKRMCEPGYHLIKDGNTVKWGAVKYYDYIMGTYRKKVVKSQSDWVGSEGEMLEKEVTFVRSAFLYDSAYGSVYLYSFKTKEGNIITWKTSYIEEEFLQGDIVIRGRVKEQNEYLGEKQTQITRAKIKRYAATA